MPSVVGGSQHAIVCPASGATQTTKLTVSETEVQRATAAKTKHEPALMADPAVIGVGVGASEDSPGQAAIEVYVDKQKTHAPIPATIDGVRTKIIATDRFHATENNTVSNEPTRGGTTQAEESLPDSEVARATAVKEKHAGRLMSDPAIIGVGIGRSADDHSSAALVIYVDKSRAVGPISAQIDDVRTRVIRTDRFRAYTAGGEQTPNPRAWVDK